MTSKTGSESEHGEFERRSIFKSAQRHMMEASLENAIRFHRGATVIVGFSDEQFTCSFRIAVSYFNMIIEKASCGHTAIGELTHKRLERSRGAEKNS